MAEIPVAYCVDFRQQLPLDKCPWCKIARPTLTAVKVEDPIELRPMPGVTNSLFWATYRCSSCLNMILAHFISRRARNAPAGPLMSNFINQGSLCYFPADDTKLDDAIPPTIASLVAEAIDIVNAPRACVVSCGTAVDAMLMEKDVTKGSLFERINAAAANHIITADMANWAHHIRLERNDGTHRPLDPAPTGEEAQLCIDFTLALADILFVLPARVTRGLQSAEQVVSTLPEPDGADNG